MARKILIDLDDELLADIEQEREDYASREQYAVMARTGMIRTLLREALDARAEARRLLEGGEPTITALEKLRRGNKEAPAQHA